MNWDTGTWDSGFWDQAAIHIQAVCASEQRFMRLMVFYFGGQIIIFIECNIRRIAENEIEARRFSKAF